MSIAVHILINNQPIGPANIAIYLVKAAFAATANPLPNKALQTAFATTTAIL